MKKFFNNLWREIEPSANELIAYSFVILAFEVVHQFIDGFLKDEFKEDIELIKQIVLISTLSLFAFHAIATLFIRVIVRIIEETGNEYAKISRSRKTEENLLNPEPLEFNQAAEVRKSKNNTHRERRRRNDRQD
jgi:hypothetical protein